MSTPAFYVRLSLSVLLAVLFASACVTPGGAPSWVDPAYAGGPLEKIVVVGVFRNVSSRRVFENQIAELINSRSGTEAVPSLDLLPPGVKYDYATMEGQFREMGFDAILIVHTNSVDKRTRYVPGESYTVRTAYPAYYYQYGSYHRYYVYSYETIRKPGYYEDTFIVSTESSLFLNVDDKMIWTMETTTTQDYETVDGITNPRQEAEKTARTILASLRARQLLQDE